MQERSVKSRLYKIHSNIHGASRYCLNLVERAVKHHHQSFISNPKSCGNKRYHTKAKYRVTVSPSVAWYETIWKYACHDGQRGRKVPYSTCRQQRARFAQSDLGLRSPLTESMDTEQSIYEQRWPWSDCKHAWIIKKGRSFKFWYIFLIFLQTAYIFLEELSQSKKGKSI